MAPLYTAVKTIIALIASVASSIATFMKTYFNFSGLKQGIGIILSVVKDQLINVKDFVFGNVIPSMIEILKTIKEPIVDFVGTLAGKAWEFMKIVGKSIGSLLKKALSLYVKWIKTVWTNIFYVAIYVFGTVTDKLLFFIPGPVSVKVIIVLTMMFYVVAGPFLKNMAEMTKFMFIPVTTMAMTIYETDIALDRLAGFKRIGA